MSHNTPTEILARVKYKLIQDIGSLWSCESITNKETKGINKTPQNIEFKIKMDLLIDIVSMEVVKR
tara:strand:+ start:1019 stop:1216 length:198 start_codon:yes stop_codon:yes gene_type:complete